MEFTGERVVPGKVEPDLLNEHLSRYYFASQLAERRRVLDVGCGTGYGSAVLAEAARRVLGLDISPEAVAFAQRNYGRPKVEFLVSDCRRMPLADASVDVVVCFEVIEHLAEQEQLLREIRRVLGTQGVALISTPNRTYYTEERQEVNRFHVREFDFKEFSAFLGNGFSHVEIAFQNHVSSLYTSGRRRAGTILSHVEQGVDDLERASNFFVAVCSNSELPDWSPLVYLPTTGNLLREREQYIGALEMRIRELDARVLEQQREYDAQGQWCSKLNQQMQERTQWSQRLEHRIQELDQRIVELQKQQLELESELRQRAEWAERLNGEIASKDQRISTLQAEFEERTAWAERLNEELRQSIEQLEYIKQSKLFRISKTLGLVPKS